MSCLRWPFKASQPVSKYKEDQYPPFTNFSIQAQDKRKAFKVADWVIKMPGVRGFEMDEEGTIKVSGEIDPTRVLKTLKRAGLEAKASFRYGECSSYLVEKPKPPSNDKKKDDGINNGAVAGGYYYPPYGGGGYDGGAYAGYGTGHSGYERGCDGAAAECSHYHKQPGITHNEHSMKAIGHRGMDPNACGIQ